MQVKYLITIDKVIEDYTEMITELGDKSPEELSNTELTLLRRVSSGSIASAKRSGKSNEEIITMDKFATGVSSGCGKKYGIDDILIIRTVELAKIFGTIDVKQGWDEWAKSNHPDCGGDTVKFAYVKSLYESWIKLAGKGI